MSERIIGKSNFKRKNVLLSLVLGMEHIAFSALLPTFWGGRGKGGWVLVVGAYLRLSGKGRRWALINFFCL